MARERHTRSIPKTKKQKNKGTKQNNPYLVASQSIKSIKDKVCIFALFDVQWVMHFSVREMLLIWGNSFIGQKRKKGLKRGSFMPFLVHLEGEK